MGNWKDDLKKAIKISTNPDKICKVSYEEIMKRIKEQRIEEKKNKLYQELKYRK